MKFSALNADFNSLNFDPYAQEAYGGVEAEYPSYSVRCAMIPPSAQVAAPMLSLVSEH